ncbi:MAG: NAD-binding protein [Methanosarcinales archaeon]|nr:MAG: NAD-binding protein [Methanosarcinales archaeon]
MVVIYSEIFIILMNLEGRSFSVITAVYWTISTLTTLGLGDIVFTSEIGRAFSSIVAVSGVCMLFAFLLPMIIMPWVERRIQAELPTKVARSMKNHILICGYNALIETLVKELKTKKHPFVLIDKDEQIIKKLSMEVPCVHGDPGDENTLKNAQISNARLLITNIPDEESAEVVLTASKLFDGKIISMIDDLSMARYIEYAGADLVVSPKHMLGTYIGRRAGMPLSKELIDVTEFGKGLKVLEFPIRADSLVADKTIRESEIREKSGCVIIGLWKDGGMIPNPSSGTTISQNSIIIALGTDEHLEKLSKLTAEYRRSMKGRYIIAGFGDVGRQAAKVLKEKKIPFTVIDKKKIAGVTQVVGSATDEEVLKRASIADASTLIVTLNTDLDNIFTTLIARKMNPNLRIISRANAERSIDKLYRAGADYVLALSVIGGQMLASMIATEEFMAETTVVEGLKVVEYKVKTPALAGKSIASTKIGSMTGCTVVAIEHNRHFIPNPSSEEVIPPGAKLMLIGTRDQIRTFEEKFVGS